MPRSFEDLGIDMRGASAHAGGNFRTTCPQCSESRRPEHRRQKCLSLNPSKGAYNCFNCGWRGYLDGADWRDSVQAYEPPSPLIFDEVSDEGQSYFAARGIGPDALAEMGVVAGHGVIKFPYFFRGQHINTKHRRIAKKQMKMEAGARLTWWNIDRVADSRNIIIVEGEIDLLTLVEAGLRNVISLPNGAQTGSMSFFNDIDWDNVDNVYLAGDMDEPGEKCMNECAARIGKEKCWRVRWPMNDANATLTEYGIDCIYECINSAAPFPIEGIEQPGDMAVREAVLNLYRNGMAKGLSTGWEHLDEGYTIATGMLDVWTGFPSSGKSEVLDNLAINLGVMHDWRFAMYSPENYPTELHLKKLAMKYTGKPFDPGPTERMTEQELDHALDWLDGRIHMLRPDTPTIDEILRLAKIEKRRFGINALTIDPWNNVIHTLGPGESVTDYTARQLTKIRQFLRQHDIRVWVLAHPRKPERGSAGLVPGPYEIAGSHNFFAMADSMVAVGRNKNDPSQPSEMHIQKVRHRHLGDIGVCKFDWAPATGIYTSVGWETGGVIL